MNAVDIQGLSKSYGKTFVLKNISMLVPQGTIYGLIGPNGAGKTTLIKAMVGALKPNAGTILVLGKDPLKNRYELRKEIGYMPQSTALYGDLSARQNIAFFGKAQEVLGLDKEVENILEFTELKERADDLVRTFSGGMQKRVSLACALIHKPKILFLDEPTAAVDPHLKQRSWELFKELAASGVTLFISTHLMDEATNCNMITILRNGEVLAVDTPANILSLGKTKIKITRGGTSSEQIIDSGSKALVTELKKHGLNSEIEGLQIEPDDLEKIVLTIINKKG